MQAFHFAGGCFLPRVSVNSLRDGAQSKGSAQVEGYCESKGTGEDQGSLEAGARPAQRSGYQAGEVGGSIGEDGGQREGEGGGGQVRKLN